MSLRWYAHDIEAYSLKTRGLTMQQDGAYRRLLAHYYQTETPLPAALPPVCRIAGATKKSERADVVFILNTYFVLDNDGWHNKRADEEIGAARDIISTRTDAGRKGAEARWQKHATAIADAIGTEDANARANRCTTTLTTTKKKKDISSEFAEFWEAYPRKLDKGHAIKAWPKAVLLATPEQIVAAARAYRVIRTGEDEKFTKYPATWLSGMCWLDHAASLNGKGPSLDELLVSKTRAEKAGIKTEKLDRAIAEKRCGQAM